MTKADVLLGLQWGDEGKGKIVDVLTPRYAAVARFQGGPNAGHTLEFDGNKYVLRSIPSGIFQNEVNILGSGVVLDPVLFEDEARALEADGHNVRDRLRISKKTHLIAPTHRMLDSASEASKGARKIGTTGKGIGPTYTDKISRCGLRVGNILEKDFKEKYEAMRARHLSILERAGFDVSALPELEKRWLKAIDYLRTFDIIDGEYEVNAMLDNGCAILCEGAQGTMLDIDFGSYPFVTSSNTVAAGACVGLGLAPRRIGEVYGIFKAYCTRVGSGPFPTELHDEAGRLMRDRGHEYGAVTGRERRCGWIDLVALKYAIMINGVTRLIMMKSDVLDGFGTIKACTAYRMPDGSITRRFPFDADTEAPEPVYTELPGWQTDLSKAGSPADFPPRFTDYIEFLERELGTEIYIVSVGPDRRQTIVRKPL